MPDSQDQKNIGNTEQQQSIPVNKWHIIIAAAVILFSVIIVVNIVLLSLLLSERTDENNEAILIHPSNGSVICGLTAQDLKQARKLSNCKCR